jgi:hypothetical protein
VLEYWKTLQPSEVTDWAELARDIRIAHAQLLAAFGNGAVFDGNDWEEQRYYHARTLYFKWMGLQAVHGVNGTNDDTLVYVPAYMTQMVSTFVVIYYALNWRPHLYLFRKPILNLMENYSKELLIRI